MYELILLVLLSCLQQVTSLHCLSCYHVVSPKHCKYVTQCSENEVCFMEKYVNSNGETLYNLGCQSNRICNSTLYADIIESSAKKRQNIIHSHSSASECLRCCNGNLCNVQGCGDDGYPKSRGHVCLACPQTSDPKLCDMIKVCNIGEVCHVYGIREFGENVYSTNCIPKQACLHHGGDPLNVIGKRRSLREGRSYEVCNACCEYDLCNSGCGNHTHTPSQGGGNHTQSGNHTHTTPSYGRPQDCSRLNPNSASGVYKIYPNGYNFTYAYCDMKTEGGGWTVIQRRFNGSLDFNRNWTDYRNGFGTAYGEYWIGNEVIHLLTNSFNRTLYIQLLGNTSGVWYHAKYEEMRVDNERNKYRLTFKQNSYSGNAGNQLNHYGPGNHNNMKFSTWDNDNDEASSSCANSLKGGWWFNNCEYGCLNCEYLARDSRWGTLDYRSTFMMIK